MVQCSFCNSTKSQRYVYTICDHFVCVNCAALRGGQALICCSKSTILDQTAKKFLALKKQSIMSNLQNDYEYEKTDMGRIGFDQIQRKLNLINQIQGQRLSKRLIDDSNDVNINNINNISDLQYDKKLYDESEHKAFQRSMLDASMQTPIKLISNPSVLVQHQNRATSQIKRSLSSKKPSNFKTQIIKLKQAPFSIQQFAPLLQTQLDFIKAEFQSIHHYLNKVQIETIQEIKVYFQEYIKLIQNDFDIGVINSSNIENQKERLKTYLQQTVQKSKLNQIRAKFYDEDIKMEGKYEKNTYDNNKQQQIYSDNKFLDQFQGSNIPLESVRQQNFDNTNRIQSVMRMNNNEQYFEHLRLNTMRDPSNNFENESNGVQPATTNRNLDKIYRKLEESRSKLQQRIQLHNQFINKRCTRMQNI